MRFLHSGWCAKLRLFAGLTLLIGGALLSSYKLLEQSRHYRRGASAPDEVSAYEARFARARQALPRTA